MNPLNVHHMTLDQHFSNLSSILKCVIEDFQTDPLIQKLKKGEPISPKEQEEVNDMLDSYEKICKNAQAFIDLVHKKYNIPYGNHNNPDH